MIRSRWALPLVILIAALVVLGPLSLLWALNVLFGLGLPYTLETWAAALVLGAAASGSARRSTS